MMVPQLVIVLFHLLTEVIAPPYEELVRVQHMLTIAVGGSTQIATYVDNCVQRVKLSQLNGSGFQLHPLNYFC